MNTTQVFYEKDYKTSRVCSDDGEDVTCGDKYPLQMDLGKIQSVSPFYDFLPEYSLLLRDTDSLMHLSPSGSFVLLGHELYGELDKLCNMSYGADS